MRRIECQREVELCDSLVTSPGLQQRGGQHAMRAHELGIHFEHVATMRDRALIVAGDVPRPRPGIVGAQAQRIELARAFDGGQCFAVA